MISQLRFYQALSAVLLVLAVWLGWDEARTRLAEYPFASQSVAEPGAPHAREVRRLIAPLKYSALELFMDPRVSLVIDPVRRNWGIRNMHQFDAQGNILLRKGRFGVCGDLAAYTYQRARRLFQKDRYDIVFLQVAESSFFNMEGGTHIILAIIDRQAKPKPRAYYLDPSLKKYGSLDLFGTYLPKKIWKSLDFVEGRQSDQFFDLETGAPVHMNSRVLISVYVRDTDGRLDENNYTVAMSGLRRYEYVSEPLVEYVKKDGKASIQEHPHNVDELLSPGIYAKLKERLLRLCGGISFVPPQTA